MVHGHLEIQAMQHQSKKKLFSFFCPNQGSTPLFYTESGAKRAHGSVVEKWSTGANSHKFEIHLRISVYASSKWEKWKICGIKHNGVEMGLGDQIDELGVAGVILWPTPHGANINMQNMQKYALF